MVTAVLLWLADHRGGHWVNCKYRATVGAIWKHVRSGEGGGRSGFGWLVERYRAYGTKQK